MKVILVVQRNRQSHGVACHKPKRLNAYQVRRWQRMRVATRLSSSHRLNKRTQMWPFHRSLGPRWYTEVWYHVQAAWFVLAATRILFVDVIITSMSREERMTIGDRTEVSEPHTKYYVHTKCNAQLKYNSTRYDTNCAAWSVLRVDHSIETAIATEYR